MKNKKTKFKMTPFLEMHRKAMDFHYQADCAIRDNDLETATTAYRTGFQYEYAVAMLLVNMYDNEPTRSSFFKSAACFLLKIPNPTLEDYKNIERTAAYGLAGHSPYRMRYELRDILMDVYNAPYAVLFPTENPTPFEYKGTFTSINISTKQFEFLTKEDKVIKGSFDSDSMTEDAIKRLTFYDNYIISGEMHEIEYREYALVKKLTINKP